MACLDHSSSSLEVEVKFERQHTQAGADLSSAWVSSTKGFESPALLPVDYMLSPRGFYHRDLREAGTYCSYQTIIISNEGPSVTLAYARLLDLSRLVIFSSSFVIRRAGPHPHRSKRILASSLHKLRVVRYAAYAALTVR